MLGSKKPVVPYVLVASVTSAVAFGCTRGPEPSGEPLSPRQSAPTPRRGTEQAAPPSPSPAPTAENAAQNAAEPPVAALPPTQPLAGGIMWTAEAPLTARRPRSQMASHEYGVDGHAEASMGVFHFPRREGGGGDVQRNIDRWVGQFRQPDGSSSAAAAQSDTREVNGVRVTTVAVGGTFAGGMGPGAGPRDNWRLLGAIAEGNDGLVFFKLTGPAEAIESAQEAFDALINSIEPAR